MKGDMKPTAFIMALAMLSACSVATLSPAEVTESVEKFYDNLDQENLVLTKLKYYIHANFGHGPNQTVYQVASAEITPSSSSNFGRILVVDNKLTVSPDPNSQKVGQYQGMNAYSDFHQPSADMIMSMTFSDGEYKGSTISILGRQPVYEEIRVLSIAAGTGAFRLARGTVLASTYSSDPVTNIGVYCYDMFVVTPTVGRSSPSVVWLI